MNASKIIQAMLELGYDNPISVELETFEIWLGDEENKQTLTEKQINEIMAKAETVA